MITVLRNEKPMGFDASINISICMLSNKLDVSLFISENFKTFSKLGYVNIISL